MKELSIKAKMTLWYTILLVIIVALVLVFMMSITDAISEKEAERRIINVLNEKIEDVEYDAINDEYNIDDDFSDFDDNVYVIARSIDKELIYGGVPDVALIEGSDEGSSTKYLEVEGRKYFYNDIFYQSEEVWLRGIVEAESRDEIVNQIISIAMFTLPVLVLFGALGGYWIAKKSFKPIDQISQAASEISEGRDLSRRIEIGEGSDEIHRLANTFDRMFERLEISFKAEEQFVADASHELRTPTSVILSQCELSLSYDQTKEEQVEAIEVIYRQSKRMAGLISQLLDFARMYQFRETVEFADVNLSRLVKMVSDEQQELHRGEKSIELHTEIDEDIIAKADTTLFARLVVNLLSNAYRYGKEDGNIELKLKEDSENIILTIEDDGIGIAKQNIEKIWNRFYQENAARTVSKSGSMGLGLAMVKIIAEIHGAKLNVESEQGKGTKFTILIYKKSERLSLIIA